MTKTSILHTIPHWPQIRQIYFNIPKSDWDQAQAGRVNQRISAWKWANEDVDVGVCSVHILRRSFFESWERAAVLGSETPDWKGRFHQVARYPEVEDV